MDELLRVYSRVSGNAKSFLFLDLIAADVVQNLEIAQDFLPHLDNLVLYSLDFFSYLHLKGEYGVLVKP